MAQLQQDTTLGGRYRLVSRIASGGMGTVWRAVDLVLDRPVAVKTLSEALGEDRTFLERFRREARAAAGLAHPNVASVYDYGEDGSTPFIVMELLDGETLARRMARGGPIPPAEAAAIARQVADALQAAHDAGVVHRDVKPANVMLMAGGEVKVMDFGIAAAAWAAPLTATGTTMGTASYLSPEQASGERATPASDVYALGCVLYEMLTGQAPFVGETPLAVAAAHLRSRPAPVRDLAPGVPASLASACERALEKHPASRPPSAGAFGAMLANDGERRSNDAAGLGATQVLRPQPTIPLSSSTAPIAPVRTKPRRPHWIGWAILAMLLALALAVVLVAALSGNEDAKRPSGGRGSPATETTPGLIAEVPGVVGSSLADATTQIVAAGLLPDVRVAPGKLGVVLATIPEGGTALKPGDSVTVFVGDGHEPKGHGKDHGDENKKKGKD